MKLISKIRKQVKKHGLTFYWLERPAFDGTQKCAGMDTEIFYPIEFLDRGEARVIEKFCNNCSFKQECFEWALVHEAYGFWGGTTPPDRERIRRANKIGLVPVEYISEFFNGDGRVGTR